MQTANDPYALTGARQEPLTSRDQIAVGHILTGTAWRTARKVVGIVGDTLHLVKYPTAPEAPGHVHALLQHGNTECACGFREEPVSGVLPLRDGMVRTYLIIPIADPPEVLPHTLYVTARGRTLRLGDGGLWNTGTSSAGSIPLIPKLAPIWTVPEALRALAQERRRTRTDF
jgi:hypothetical protein